MRAVLYRFFDRDDHLLYIGITANGAGRWAQHSVEQPWWPLVSRVGVQHCDSVAEAEYLEREAIRAEHPAHNQRHTGTIRQFPRRVPSGRGTVFQRGSNGRWIAAISEGSRVNRRRTYRSASTRAEAERLLREMLAGVTA